MVRNVFITYLISAVVILIGILLPWVSYMGLSVNGSDSSDGKLTLVFFAIVLVAAVLIRVTDSFIGLALGILGCLATLAIGIYEIFNISSHSGVNIGAGVFVIIVGALIGLLGNFVPASRVVR